MASGGGGRGGGGEECSKRYIFLVFTLIPKLPTKRGGEGGWACRPWMLITFPLPNIALLLYNMLSVNVSYQQVSYRVCYKLPNFKHRFFDFTFQLTHKT